MQMNWMLLLVSFPVLPAALAAEVCNPANLVGPYAFQLTGSTDISGTPKPTVSIGRITFDGEGGLSGTASAAFSGLLLGNPVTGSYEAKADCSVTWKLQDDSGAFQNFSGTLSTDGTRVQFKQTDPGGAQSGIMKKTPDTCSAGDLRKKYAFTVSGSTEAMQPADVPHPVSAKGTVDTVDNGSFEVESDCPVRFTLTIPAQDGRIAEPPVINMRGFLADGGNEILAVETDPGAVVAGRLIATEK